jgi:hypothetical protein
VFEDAGVELPSRRVITVGEAAIEDESVTIMWGGTLVGPPANEVTLSRGETPRSATFDVQIWRSVVQGRGGAHTAHAPRPDAIADKAFRAMMDAWLLMDVARLVDVEAIGTLASTAALPPSGGLQGVAMTLTLAVP